MDLKLIRNLVRLMERGEVTELEIDDEKAGLRVHLRRGEMGAGAQAAPVVMMGGAASPTAAVPAAPAAGPASATTGEADGSRAGLREITSPMVGTFYRASSPEAAPFATGGSGVEDETTVCIIEAMKVMNEIKAECSGEIVEILVENGDPVEFGQPLFLVK